MRTFSNRFRAAAVTSVLLLATAATAEDQVCGDVYDNGRHGLTNARDLIEVLRAAPKRPIAVVHGHEHHGFRVDLALDELKVPIFDPGSGGYAHMPERRRAACMNLYEIDARGVLRVERYMYGADGFLPEAGGAYATGR